LTDDAEYSQKQTELLHILTEIDRADYDTKRQYIIRLIEVSRPLVQQKDNLANYINAKLLENNISYPRNGQYFYNLFEENEKHTWGTNLSSTLVEHEHKFDQSADPRFKTCECGMVQFESILYEKAPEVEQPEEPEYVETLENEKRVFDPYTTPITEYLALVGVNCIMLKKIADDLIFKFNINSKITDILKRKIPHPEVKIREQKNLQAKLLYIEKLNDFRNKIGQFEKIKAILLMETTFLVAKVAKMLSITPKHATNNIHRNKEEYMKNLKWFKQIHLNCKHCGSENEYDIGDWYNEQLIRKKIGLTLEQPFS